MIEVYNPSSSAKNLSNYTIHLFNNGAVTPNYSFTPSGNISAKGTYVIANSQADTAILTKADTTGSVTFFNGNDALVLLNGSDTLDIIGIVGNDPGTSWPVGSDDTKDNTLVRADTVTKGTADWALSATQWDTYPQDDTTDLTGHTSTACTTSSSPNLSFAQTSASVVEDSVTVTVDVAIANENQNTTSVDVLLTGGSATDSTDFNFPDPVTLTFPGGTDTSQTFTLSVLDDTISEVDETVELELANPTNNATLTADSVFTLTIVDDDNTTMIADIADYTSVDANCIADSSGTQATFQATVISRNYRNSGLQFFIQDSTGGMGVFSFSNSFGYTVEAGDRVQIAGSISQFMGLTQMEPDTVIELSANNSLPSAQLVTGLDESTEGERVVFRDAWVVDTAAWNTSAGSGFDVQFTNGTDTIDARIDDQMSFFNIQPFTDTVDVYGVGSQFSNDTCTGYQLYPTDIKFQLSNPTLLMETQDQAVPEATGQIAIDVGILNPDTVSATTVHLATAASSTADSASDFTLATDSVTFPAGSNASQSVTLNIIDDTMSEPDETVTLKLVNPTNNATLSDSLVTITIEDDDRPLPEYTIDEVDNATGPNCEADSVGVECVLTGVVHSSNFRSSGYDFYMQDSTGGINVFEFSNVSGYTNVQVGDRLRIEGVIDQFNGLQEIKPDSIAVLSTGNPLVAPDTVTQLSESNEGDHVLFADAWLVDKTNWIDTASGAGFNVRFTNGADTIDARVDNNSPFFTASPLTDTVNVIGSASQYDTQSPFCENYQILPSRFDTLATSSDTSGDDDTDTTGITTLANDEEVTIYPNPAEAQINVRISSSHNRDVKLTIRDIQGRVRKEVQASSGRQTVPVELSSIAPGMYFLTIQQGDERSIRRFVKQ